MTMAKPRSLFNIECVAKDIDWLMDLPIELQPEDGGLSIYVSGKQWLYLPGHRQARGLHGGIQILAKHFGAFRPPVPGR